MDGEYVISKADEREWKRLRRWYLFGLWCVMPVRLLLLWPPYIVCKAFEGLGDGINWLDRRIMLLAIRRIEDKQDALVKRVRRERRDWNDARFREETDRLFSR